MMYGRNKKQFKPVSGGMKIQKPVAPNSDSGLSLTAAKQAMDNASLKKRALRLRRGA